MKYNPPRVLTIAGSDSGGGAGIQADLKTFAALEVFGMSVLTSVTAQNTKSVIMVQDINPQVILAQIEAVVDDIGVDVIKTGMLHTEEIIDVVSKKLMKYRCPKVVDPVMISKSGVSLLREDAVDVFKKKLLPLATVVTPNRMEAEKLTGLEINNLDDVKKAAKKLAQQGSTAVVVKGGHLPTRNKVIDTLYYENNFLTFETNRIETMNTHGTGCTFASAIAAEIAKDKSIAEAVKKAKKVLEYSVKYAYSLGEGNGPVNSMALLYHEAEKYHVLREVKEAVGLLEKNPEVAVLIPETNSNIGMALSLADTILDVVAIPGRITKIEFGVRASSCPSFGASNHVARMIITAMKYDQSVRSAINVKYSEEILDICKNMNMCISSYERSKEPDYIKKKEGESTSWGIHQAVNNMKGKVPDIIYHKGDFGKEPMIIIMGKCAIDVARIVISLAKKMTMI